MSVSHIYPILIGIGQTNNNTLKSGWCDQHSYNDSAMVCLDNGNQKHVQNEQINARKAQNSTISMDINNNGSHYTSINEVIYKFYVPRNVGLATAYIAFSRVCLQCPLVGFHMQANAFPSVRTETGEAHEQASLYSTYIEVNSTDEISITFNVQPMVWHYALLKFTRESNFSLSDNLTHGIPFQFRIDYFDSFEISNFSTNYDNNGYSLKPRHFRDIELYPLLRQTYRDFFMFDYDLIPDENGTVPTLFNLTSGITTGFSFSIGEVYDIGGTLSFAVSMKNENNASSIESMMSFPIMGTASERSGILAEKLVGGDKAYKSNESEWKIGKVKQMGDPVLINQTNRTIIICMHHGEPGEPTWPDKCRYHGHLLAAASIINNSFTNTNNGLIHVPFPESGQWYITMGLYCHGADVRVNIIENVKVFVKNYAHMLESMPQYCACGTNVASYKDCVNDSKCLAAMNETVTFKIKECLLDSKCTANHLEMTHKFKIHQKSVAEQHLAIGNCSASVEFTISSSPCIAGRCGRFGKCFHYMSGGFVFSTCVCMKGYRGWDCTEDSQVPSSISILFASLILIFSNLLFIPSIYMAVCRNFYTEAVIYFFSMFFSIFYHACDSGEDEYSFCVVKIGVLQFCDFYCGLLAIWVTLVAMSHIRQQYVSLLHMVGAIMLAFATELNKQSLWAFLAPALTGICLISTSWGLRCYKSRKWFPSRKYLTIYLPLGTVLTMVGLVCYAFLQTKQNYHIVHSVWHMVMALSIQCLLPSPKSFTPKC